MLKGALIGDPVSKSISHLTHPRIFQQIGIEASYEKVCLSRCDLPLFFTQRAYGFDWIAVTMPLKADVIPYLHKLLPTALAASSVNTIYKKEGKLFGDNNDGVACLDAIEERTLVKGQRVVVAGTGGAARPVILEAKKRGAFVFVLSREMTRARALAQELGVFIASREKLTYDIFINATSVGMAPESQTSILREYEIQEGKIIFDMVYAPVNTKLMQLAKSKNCITISGWEMFAHLSRGQIKEATQKEIQKDLVHNTVQFFLS